MVGLSQLHTKQWPPAGGYVAELRKPLVGIPNDLRHWRGIAACEFHTFLSSFPHLRILICSSYLPLRHRWIVNTGTKRGEYQSLVELTFSKARIVWISKFAQIEIDVPEHVPASSYGCILQYNEYAHSKFFIVLSSVHQSPWQSPERILVWVIRHPEAVCSGIVTCNTLLQVFYLHILVSSYWCVYC